MKYLICFLCSLMTTISFAQSVPDTSQNKKIFMCFLAKDRLEKAQNPSNSSALALPFIDYSSKTKQATKAVAQVDENHVMFLSPGGLDVINLRKDVIEKQGITQDSGTYARDKRDPKDDSIYVPNTSLGVTSLTEKIVQRRHLTFPDGTELMLDLPYKADGSGWDNASPITYAPDMTDFKPVDFEQRLQSLESQAKYHRQALVVASQKYEESCRNSKSGNPISGVYQALNYSASDANKPSDINMRTSLAFVKKFDEEIKKTKELRDTDLQKRKDIEARIPKLQLNPDKAAENEKFIKKFLSLNLKKNLQELVKTGQTSLKPQVMDVINNCKDVSWNGEFNEIPSLEAFFKAWPDPAPSSPARSSSTATAKAVDKKPEPSIWEKFYEGRELLTPKGP